MVSPGESEMFVCVSCSAKRAKEIPQPRLKDSAGELESSDPAVNELVFLGILTCS